MAYTGVLRGGLWPEGFFDDKPRPTDGEETAPDLIIRWVMVALALPGFTTLSYGPSQLGFSIPIVVLVAFAGTIALVTQSQRSGHTHRALVTWYLVAGGYLGAKLAMLQFGLHHAGLADLYTSYKAWVFLIPVVFFMGRNCFSVPGLVRTTKLFLTIFFFKYGIAVGLGVVRPVVWIENNYELMLIIGLFFLTFDQLGRRRPMWIAAIIAVVAMSGSRSAILEICVCMLVLYWRPAEPKFYLHAVPGIGLAWAAYMLLESGFGPGGLKGTDRYSFFEVFRMEAANWQISEWLFGTAPLTPLSYTSCGKLSYYQPLFSGTSHDVCYSVILHSFLLRGIYDHGILGIAFLLAVLAVAMQRAGIAAKGVVGILGICSANATSVAAFHSDYCLLLLVLAVGTAWGCQSADIDRKMDALKVDATAGSTGHPEQHDDHEIHDPARKIILV